MYVWLSFLKINPEEMFTIALKVSEKIGSSDLFSQSPFIVIGSSRGESLGARCRVIALIPPFSEINFPRNLCQILTL